jgi:SAM-dependent methyltransferase
MSDAEPRDLRDPSLISAEYDDESRLAARRRVWHEFLDGPTSDDLTLSAVAALHPARVLEVGAGWGELSARIRDRVTPAVVSTDLSPRMVRLARERGLRALRADAGRLPFPDGTFDAVVANAMLYHLPDLDAGIDELARVLAPGGALVATTFGHDHVLEAWELVGGPQVDLRFSADDGAGRLGRRFEHVETRRERATLTFPDAGELRTYVAATITRSHLVDRVPEFDGPFIAHSDVAVFVAREPRGHTAG